MTWFEKIKSMTLTELAEFLSDFDADEDITNYFCKHICAQRDENGSCKEGEDCLYSNIEILKIWLTTKVTEN